MYGLPSAKYRDMIIALMVLSTLKPEKPKPPLHLYLPFEDFCTNLALIIKTDNFFKLLVKSI